jgi:hypothetical protein
MSRIVIVIDIKWIKAILNKIKTDDGIDEMSDILSVNKCWASLLHAKILLTVKATALT